jgi:multiple antibiotic resistance protein
MTIDLEFFILSFSSLFVLIDPIGIVPIFISITEEHNKKERDLIALKAVIFAFFVLILFSLIGELIFSFYNITIHGFRIAGGILLFKISLDMVESKRSRTRTTPMEEKDAEEKDEIAYNPLGVPLIAGPGSIASIMILSSESSNWNHKINLFFALATVLLITFLTLRLSKYLTKTFGRSGLRIVKRIMGLLLMVISIEFILKGIQGAIKTWSF